MNGHAEEAHHHIVPPSVYYAIFVLLMLGTGLTVAAAFVDLGPLNIVVALGIAVAKASLVVLFFMHVKYGDRLNWVVIGSGLFWLLILLSMLMLDYGSRAWMNIPRIQHVS
jgi:cytochrome c oxidase subunit IV